VRESRRYLGLELAGAKNQKTALAALEFYPKEKKIFLLDIYDRIAGHRPPESGAHPHHAHHSAHGAHAAPFALTTAGDEALLELLAELTEDATPESLKMGVNVPLELPPGISCGRKACSKPSAATLAAVKWMRETHRKAERHARTDQSAPRVTEYTTYTQRPVELWVRYHVMGRLPESHRFEIDETLGGNKAPLTARMHFIRRHLAGLPLLEVWPKLTIALLGLALDLPKRTIQTYRRLEEGVHAREQILERLAEAHDVFIYERDVRKLSHSLPAFDAFVCAYTALLSDSQKCAKIPTGFPAASGWIHYPQC
jgi:hypothetical protein